MAGTRKKFSPQYRDEAVKMVIDGRPRLRQLEAEARELKMEKKFLGKAAAFFASKHQ